jgi:hypothetical protein
MAAKEFGSTEPISLEHVAHHEAGHAVMHLMYGDYIKSISIVRDRRRGHFGIVKTCGPDRPQEADLLCKLAGPVGELLYMDPERISRDTFCDLHNKADLEGVFEVGKVTMNRYFKHLNLCIEVMSQPDFRSAVNLLASRLMEHKYLCHERVIRMKDCELWNVYSTSDTRIKHAKKSPTKAMSQMIRRRIGQTKDYFAAERRRDDFAKAVAAYWDDSNNPDLSVMIDGREIPVVKICDLMIADEVSMPDELAATLSLIPPVKYAKSAAHLKQSIALPTDGGWGK